MGKRNKGLDRPRSEGPTIERTCISTGVTHGTGEDYNRRTMNFGEKKPSELWGVKR